MRRGTPEGDDWKEHADSCPCCKEPVLSSHEHYRDGGQIDPGWWECDFVEGGTE